MSSTQIRVSPYAPRTATCTFVATPAWSWTFRPSVLGPVTERTVPGTAENRTYPRKLLSTVPSPFWAVTVTE